MGDPNFARRWFVGEGLDIGGKPDPLSLYVRLLPGMTAACGSGTGRTATPSSSPASRPRAWTSSIPATAWSTWSTSAQGLKAWFAAIKPRRLPGHHRPGRGPLRAGRVPSSDFNRDHKWTFTILKAKSWADRSINVLELPQGAGPGRADVEKVALLQLDLPLRPAALRPDPDADRRVRHRVRGPQAHRPPNSRPGAWCARTAQPSPADRRHFNQYRADHAHLKTSAPPFEDESPL